MSDLLFGWLLRGRCEVRALDGFMLLLELFILFIILVAVFMKESK